MFAAGYRTWGSLVARSLAASTTTIEAIKRDLQRGATGAIADSHTKQRKNIKTNHDRKTAHGTSADFFFFCRLKIHLSSIPFFTTQVQTLLHKSRVYKKSASYEYSRWTRTDGIATSLRFSTTTARERTVTARAPSQHSGSRAADNNTIFTTTRYILFAHGQSDVGCLVFVLGPLPHAHPGDTHGRDGTKLFSPNPTKTIFSELQGQPGGQERKHNLAQIMHSKNYIAK